MFENQKITEAYANMNSPSCVTESYSSLGLTELNEASLYRIFKNGVDLGYCIISACRHDWSDYMIKKDFGGEDTEEWENVPENTKHLYKDNKYWNNIKTKALIQDLKNSGFGYIPLYGGYKESGDVQVYEKSFMVFPVTRDQKPLPFSTLMDEMVKLGGEDYYRQDAILIKPPHEAPYYYVTTAHSETPGDPMIPVGTEQRWFGKESKLNDVAQAYFTSLNKVGEYPTDGKSATVKRFTFNESTCKFVGFSEKADSYQAGHVRWAKGQLNHGFKQ